MKFQRYLNEKFFDAVHSGGYNGEVFVNPDKKEIRDILGAYDTGDGFRFFIDLKKKKVYLFNGRIFHRIILKEIPFMNNELKISWMSYWEGIDNSIEYVIMGSCDKNMNNLNSDVFYNFINSGKALASKTLPKLKKLEKLDYSWLSKYGFTPSQVRDLVTKTIIDIEKKSQGE